MIKTRKMKKFKESGFLSDVGGIAWEQTLTKTDDIDALVDYWTGIFSFTIDKHARFVKCCVRKVLSLDR